MHPAKTQSSLGICPVWSESSLSAWGKLGTLVIHWTHSEDSEQTGWMPRLISLRWAHIVMRWLRHVGPFALYSYLSVVSNDSVSGQRRPWSDCAHAQSDLGLPCPQMPEDTLQHGTANVIRSLYYITNTYKLGHWISYKIACAHSGDSISVRIHTTYTETLSSVWGKFCCFFFFLLLLFI